MKINFRQYSLMSLSVFIAFSGISHAATTYMEARNDAMGNRCCLIPLRYCGAC